MMSNANGALAAPNPASAEIVNLLDRLLQEARSGRLLALGVIAVAAGGEVVSQFEFWAA